MNENLENFITQFNSAWTQGNMEDLSTLLHENVIFIAPDLKTEIVGKASCIQTIKEYVENAKTEKFYILNKNIHIWNTTAVISIEYVIEYEMKNKSYKEKGKEFWTLHNQMDKWQMIWRAMVENKPIVN